MGGEIQTSIIQDTNFYTSAYHPINTQIMVGFREVRGWRGTTECRKSLPTYESNPLGDKLISNLSIYVLLIAFPTRLQSIDAQKKANLNKIIY